MRKMEKVLEGEKSRLIRHMTNARQNLTKGRAMSSSVFEFVQMLVLVLVLESAARRMENGW
jgi:hypothetical protein